MGTIRTKAGSGFAPVLTDAPVKPKFAGEAGREGAFWRTFHSGGGLLAIKAPSQFSCVLRGSPTPPVAKPQTSA